MEAVTDDYLKGGLYFPKANDYFLGDGKAQTTCHPKPFQCHSALLYARSRHGTQGNGANSDYSRARRQMDLIMAAADQTHARGYGGNLNALVDIIRDHVWSNLPKTTGVAEQFYNLIYDLYVPYKDAVVFGPRKWAYRDGSTPGYTFRLRLPLVRSWIKDHFHS
jgi:hypothetical protein